jgi:hypothetical protein
LIGELREVAFSHFADREILEEITKMLVKQDGG